MPCCFDTQSNPFNHILLDDDSVKLFSSDLLTESDRVKSPLLSGFIV